jgi:LPXTG-motif cell wall-anchored protein
MSSEVQMVRKLVAMALLVVAAAAVAPVAVAASSGYEVDNVGNSTPAPGDTIRVVFNGFKPGSDVTITLYSDPVVLGTFVSQRGEFGQGVVEALVTIPLSTPPGQHRVVATGIDAKGQPRTVTQFITVSTASGRLPTTGGGSPMFVLTVGGMTVLLGSALLEIRRRRGAAA